MARCAAANSVGELARIVHNAAKLLDKLRVFTADAAYSRELGKINRQQVLILDVFGIQPFEAENSAALMEIIEDQHGTKSNVVSSQIPVSK